MSETLHVLVIEDSEADYLLIQRQLVQQGLSARCHRVDGLAQLEEQLRGGTWDVVLSDYSVPGLDVGECFARIQALAGDLPVVVVSGTVGEEQVVALLKMGVTDLVLKDNLGRLGSAVTRALKDATVRRDRRVADEQLALLHAALNAAADAVVLTDRQGTIQWINPAFAALTGYTREEALGKNPRDLVRSGVQPPEFYESLWREILEGRVWQGELTNRRKDGQLYPERQSITPVRNASGTITHFVGIKRDLTREKQLQAQFTQAQKMETVGRLAGGVAHDFNNLITAINGTADLAMLKLAEGDPLRRDLARITEAGERAASLTRQLLAFSRKQIMIPDNLDLNAVVAGMQDLIRRLVGEDIDLRVLPAADVWTVLADRGQVEQILMNLVVNARDAMPRGGALTIETRNVELDEACVVTHPSVRPGPHVMLAVSDVGIGMDEATRSRIFEPFFTTKEQGRGTGLGLSTVYGIVKQSGGSIWVYSEPGSGTTFKVYLPRVEGIPAATAPRPAPTTVGGTETILVVEDEEFLRDLACRILRRAGYVALSASDGAEARQVIERHAGRVDLVLTDVVMPGIRGPELAVLLAARYPALKVVFTSGYTDDVILRHGMLDCAAHFLSKPYSMEELTRKVREVLDEPADDCAASGS